MNCNSNWIHVDKYTSIQNKTNSNNGHLVQYSWYSREKQESNGIGDISFLFERHCQTNHWFRHLVFLICKKKKQENIHSSKTFQICFFPWISTMQDVHFRNLFFFYLLKLSVCRGFWSELRKKRHFNSLQSQQKRNEFDPDCNSIWIHVNYPKYFALIYVLYNY